MNGEQSCERGSEVSETNIWWGTWEVMQGHTGAVERSNHLLA